jgi:hypothetical protein
MPMEGGSPTTFQSAGAAFGNLVFRSFRKIERFNFFWEGQML